MKYIKKNYGLIGTMINKTLAEKNAYFYFSKELSTKYVKKIKMAISPYANPGLLFYGFRRLISTFNICFMT